MSPFDNYCRLFVFPPNSHVKILTPNVSVLESRTLVGGWCVGAEVEPY